MTVYVLHISKEGQLDGSSYPNHVTEVGENKEALIQHLLQKYATPIESLVKNEDDNFPYFTDGGFKYYLTTPYWKYTFTCYPQELLKSL